MLSKALPTTHKFKCEYVNDATLALDQRYMQALNDGDMVTNNHTKTPQDPTTQHQSSPTNNHVTISCDGAYMHIKDCLDALMKKVHEVLKKNKIRQLKKQ